MFPYTKFFFVSGYTGNDKRFNIDRQVEGTKTTEEEMEGPASLRNMTHA
jgi:hypothetical protein